MTTNLSKKFKDRDPLDTIKILTDFFESYNFRLDLTNVENKVGTFSSHVDLFYNDIYLLHSNGKGTSKEFSTASALAELYERFCNQLWIPYSHLYRLNNLEPDSTDLYHKIDINDIKSESYVDKEMGNGNSNFTKLILNKYSFNNKLKLNKYINIQDENDIKYLSHLHIATWKGTTGMSTGNTIEEALVQCISEIFERLSISNVIDNPNQTFYKADISNCSDYLKHIINQTNKNGKLYIIDFSYNISLPVMIAIFFDSKTNSAHYNFSSAPVKDIAIERVLTELYQGINNTEGFKQDAIFQMPSKMIKKSNIKLDMFSHCSARAFPEQIVLNLVDSHSNDNEIFLKNQEYSNIELLDYVKKLAKSVNLDLYYTDVSLIDEIKSVHIYCKQFYNDDFPPMENSEVDIYDYVTKLYNMYHNICETKTIDYSLFGDLIMHTNRNISRILFTSRSLTPFPDTYPAMYAFYDLNLKPEIFYDLEFNKQRRINSCFDRYINRAKTWLEIYNYLMFTDTQICDIINYYKNYIPSLSEEDINRVKSREFLILKIVFEPFLESVLDDSLDGVLQPFLDKEMRDGVFSS